MFNWKDVRSALLDFARGDYTPQNGKYVLIGGNLWLKNSDQKNSVMKKVCTSEQFHEYVSLRDSQYEFDFDVTIDGDLKSVNVVIIYISTTANEFDAQPIYLTPQVYINNDCNSVNVWSLLKDDDKRSVEVEAFLKGGYCK